MCAEIRRMDAEEWDRARHHQVLCSGQKASGRLELDSSLALRSRSQITCQTSPTNQLGHRLVTPQLGKCLPLLDTARNEAISFAAQA